MNTKTGDRRHARALASYIAHERLENIDPAARQRIKWIIVHHVSLAFRGIAAQEEDSMRAVQVARELSDGCGLATIIGHRFRAALIDAVSANCQLMRSFGQDDVILKTGVHPALVTLPLALGIGERHRRSGADLMVSLAVGYEVLGKFAQWSWALEVPRRATMPFGAFGGLATASRLLGFSEERTATAMAYAAHMAMGLAENDAGPISHFYPLVCRNALIAAYYVRAGAWGSETAIEGKFGFIDTFLGGKDLDIEAVVKTMGRDFAVEAISEKRYPGTALNQVPIELMRQLVVEQNLRIGEIKCIRVQLPEERQNFEAGHATGPFTKKTAPSSLAFQFGMLLLDGDLVASRYGDVENPKILAAVAATNVSFVSGKRIRYARIEVETRDGRTYIREGDEFAFEPYGLEQMMNSGAKGLLSEPQIERFLEYIEGLEDLEDVSRLAACLVPEA